MINYKLIKRVFKYLLMTYVLVLALFLGLLGYKHMTRPTYRWDTTKTTFDAFNYIEDDKEDRILYWGFEGCPWCSEAKPVLEEVAKEYDLPVYYIQTSSKERGDLLTDAQRDILEGLLKDNKDYFDKEGKFHFYVPTTMIIKDGKINSAHMGTVKGHNAHEREMTDKEKEELKGIFEEMIDPIQFRYFEH